MKLTLNIDEFSYKNKTVFKNLSYEFYSSNIYVIKGKNGSGKTTLLSILSGIITEYKGTLYLNESQIIEKNKDSYFDSYISYMPQKSIVFDDMTCLENIKLNQNKSEENKAIEILNKLQLGDYINKKAKNLSSGEKQRLAFARVILNARPILLLDEITANLDITNRTIILNYLEEIKKNHLIIYVTNETDLQIKNSIRLNLENNNIKDVSGKQYEIKSENVNLLSKNNDLKKDNIFKNIVEIIKKDKLFYISFFIFFLVFNIFSLFITSSSELGNNIVDNNLIMKSFMDTTPVYIVYSDEVDITKFNDNDIIAMKDFGPTYIGKKSNLQILGSYCTGMALYNENIDLKIEKGRAPQPIDDLLGKEIIISTDQEKYLDTPLVLNETKLYLEGGNKYCKVVGVYQAEAKEEEYGRFVDVQPKTDFFYSFTSYSRKTYSFKSETIFAGEIEQEGSYYILNNNLTSIQKKYITEFISKNGLYHFNSAEFTYPIIATKKGKSFIESDFVNHFNKKYSVLHNSIIKLGFELMLINVAITFLYCLLFVIRNRKKLILLRTSMYPKKRLIRDYICTSTMFVITLSTSIAILSSLFIVLLNVFYNSTLIHTTFYLFFPFTIPYFFILLIGIIIIIPLIYLLIKFFILKKNRNNELKE